MDDMEGSGISVLMARRDDDDDDKWCNYTVVLIRLQFGKKSRFILLEISGFEVVINLSIAGHALS